MATGAERARRSRLRKLNADPEGFRAAERERGRVYRRATYVIKVPVHVCRGCGWPVHHRGFCGDRDCQRERNRLRQGKYQHVRRVRMLGAVTELFDPTEVFDRDGWICGICGDGVDPDAARDDLMRASLDHVLPISKGGEHTRQNTRCSHLRCNVARSDRTT